jgi:photosystem II stability/assembly factor-like uncharacterized protein
VYSEFQGGHMFRTQLSTMKAEGIQPQRTSTEEKLRWNWNTPIVTGAKNPKNLYVGAQYLYRSKDQGRNWTRISPDLTTNDKKKQQQEESGGLSEDNTSAENHCTIFSIAESPLDENLVWAGTDDGNLQVTTDGGKTWRNCSSAIALCGIAKQTWVSSIEPSRFDKNTVFATFDNHMYGDMRTYLAKSTDMGKTWARISHSEFTGYAHKIKQDPENPNMLFLGAEMGLFATVDGGNNWFRMKNNIPEYLMTRDIQIHPVTHDLIVASHGRGIFIVDDIRPMRLLTKDVLEKDVHVFPTPDIVLNNGRFGWGGPEVSGGWNANNPPDKPMITYYLKQRVTSGKVSIDILDEKGGIVQTFPGTLRKGINTVSWNLRSTPPKVAEGSTKLDGAGFTAPMVMPGTYGVRLKIKDKEYLSKLNCIHDTANHDLTPEDRKLVFDKSMQLMTLYNKVNLSIDSIMHLQASLKSDSVVFRKNKNLKLFHDDLQLIKAELMATKKTSIFADEERIRERVSELYGTFCGMEAKPNSTQLEAITVLQKDYDAQEEKFKKTLAMHLPKVKMPKDIK